MIVYHSRVTAWRFVVLPYIILYRGCYLLFIAMRFLNKYSNPIKQFLEQKKKNILFKKYNVKYNVRNGSCHLKKFSTFLLTFLISNLTVCYAPKYLILFLVLNFIPKLSSYQMAFKWVQNNSIFLDSIVNFKKNKILHRTFHLKNASDSDKN
jgi:hypothetical protein